MSSYNLDATVAIVIQARFNSKRLPGKVLKKIDGQEVLSILINRLKNYSFFHSLILATTENRADDQVANLGRKHRIAIFRGSENDVLKRFVDAVKNENSNLIVRLTADCPFLDPEIIIKAIKKLKEEKLDYVSNCFPPSFPDGMDIEVFTKDSLLLAHNLATSQEDREHVTKWIRENKQFKTGVLINEDNLSNIRLTIDYPEDILVAEKIAINFKENMNFKWSDLSSFINLNRDIFLLNKQYIRNEGSNKLSGQKLWDRAKKIIPGGNMLLSKRPDMFLPNKWPTYFSTAKGCKVRDLDGQEYIDMSIMGIGTNILGYSNSEVDNAVKEAVNKGNMSTLNCPEEVELAEKLISMHSWADMARFARSGGEANSIAIRIARAATGKEKVAICGYHGWHDWYLATNLENNSALKDHLLPGLDPNGVPPQLKGTVFPFRYNQFKQLHEIVNENDIGTIKMEVERNNPPEKNFLQKIRKLCDEKGIVLIFDECTSGFRETFGGLHKKYQVEPDMAMFGKAIGNGFALTSIIGRKIIMEATQNTFISSTFWTERIGSVASLKTLEIMERIESWKIITKKGKKIKKGWQSIADSCGIGIDIGGLDALASFSFVHKDNLKFKTLITQEMLKKNFLAGNCCYVCIDHTDEIIDMYLNNLLEIFKLISMCIRDEELIENLLDDEICTSGFKRLN